MVPSRWGGRGEGGTDEYRYLYQNPLISFSERTGEAMDHFQGFRPVQHICAAQPFVGKWPVVMNRSVATVMAV